MNKQPLQIPEEHKKNLAQIIHAASHGQLGILSTYCKDTGKPAFLLVARNELGGDRYEIVPFGKLWGPGENPIDMFEDPTECECNDNNDNNLTITE